MRVGRGIGPATLAPVRLAVSTISPALWSRSLESYALSRMRIFCVAIRKNLFDGPYKRRRSKPRPLDVTEPLVQTKGRGKYHRAPVDARTILQLLTPAYPADARRPGRMPGKRDLSDDVRDD